MPALLLDSTGKPIPQYKNAAGTAFEAVRGASGAMDVNVKSLVALAAGTNKIGEVTVEPVAIYKYVASCSTYLETDVWTPAAGKSIVLKGLRIQNFTTIVSDVATGLATDVDAIVDVLADASIIMSLVLPSKQVISDATDKIFVQTPFGSEMINFGEGLQLPADAVLSVDSSAEDVTISAWGYEV